MSSAYLEFGRVEQKQRTRDQLLAAARSLIDNGATPSANAVAEVSGISRATAYRYFPSQAALLAAAFPETAMTSLLPSPAPDDVAERVRKVAAAVIDVVARTESQQRAMLRLSLSEQEHELPLRQGRAIAWFEEALEPLEGELGDGAVLALAMALRSVCGIESRVWLGDVGLLDDRELRALQLWMADAVVSYASETPPPALPSRRDRRET